MALSPQRQELADPAPEGEVVIGLNVAVVAVTDEEPRVLTVRRVSHTLGGAQAPGAAAPDDADVPEALPFGPFEPLHHRTLASGLRGWVEEQTSLKLGYVEQLYTFADRGRDPRERQGGPRVISIGYLALVREARPGGAGDGIWQNWYHYFPWEDWRDGKPPVLDKTIRPLLERWARAGAGAEDRLARTHRIATTFAPGGGWNDERVLERYELLYEAGLVAEAVRDRSLHGEPPPPFAAPALGQPMALDHRRILATAMGRLRGKIKYRPVVFELMPPTFTLLQLQRAVEALAGARLHKQNFRRLVESTGLVERTGKRESRTGGRPAEQFRFRREVLVERPAQGVRLSVSRRPA
ncbi:MAG TPA: hypothetical protein VMU42_19550 [Candidatus Sulfotelmatobacter sp.]|nr:hypothetical protein [Candidatus Sulfotelmatobacter sp.]